jgi:hypothetical protein
VAAICHSPQVLISAGLVRGRKMTSWPAIQVDMRNAGANWIDQEVVLHNGLVSSRKSDAFSHVRSRSAEIAWIDCKGISGRRSQRLAFHRNALQLSFIRASE